MNFLSLETSTTCCGHSDTLSEQLMKLISLSSCSLMRIAGADHPEVCLLEQLSELGLSHMFGAPWIINPALFQKG